MGADQVGYIVVGPIKGYTKAAAKRIVDAYSADALAARTNNQEVECSECGEMVLASAGECKECGVSFFIDRKEAMELVLEWPPDGRDVASRHYKGKLIVYAGDQTWGDEPSGNGYQYFKKIFNSGLHNFMEGIE